MAFSRGNEAVERLAREAQLSARIRSLQTDADVVALHVERVRTQVEWLTWTSIGLGLLFTLVNVQQFAAGSAAPLSFPWFIAWLLDPMVSLALIAVLRAEMVTARYQLSLNGWAHATKWAALLLTYIMNTWASFAAGSPAQVILHSVPVAMVFMVANASPGIRDRLTEAVVRAAEEAASRVSDPEPEPVIQPMVLRAQMPIQAPVHAAEAVVTAPVASAASKPQKPRSAPVSSSKRYVPDEEARAGIQRMWLELGSRPGIRKVRDAFGGGDDRARDLIASVQDPTNGHREAVSA